MEFLAIGDSALDVTQFLLGLAVLLGSAKLLGEVARALRQPAVLGEILAGILLGPTVLGRFAPTLTDWMFPATGASAVALTGYTTIAVALLLLVAGIEVDLSTIFRQGRLAGSIVMTGLVIPFGVGFGAAWLFAAALGKEPSGEPLPFALFIGIAMSITALPVISKILIDLDMLKSDMGTLIMSAAMIEDLIGWLTFAFVLALIGGDAASFDLPGILTFTVLFVVGMLTLGRWAIHRTLPFMQANLSWPGGVLCVVLTIALLCAAFTEWVGVHAILGAFVAGVAIGDSSHMHERTRDTIHQFVTNIFAPVFFGSIGLRVNFIENFDLQLVLIILAIAVATKVGGCWIGARFAGMSQRESLAIGFCMCARGAMEIVLGQIALHAGLISERLFVALVVMALVTSLMAGPAIKRSLRLEQRRSLRDFVTDRGFIPVMRARRKREAIAELSGRAAQIAKLPKRDIFHAVWSQERSVDSGIERGIAVPRARIQGLARPVVVIGLAHQGIDFDARDGHLARVICLILTPEGDHRSQVDLLQMVARSLYAESARKAVLASRSFTQFRAALSVSGETVRPDTLATS
jgi:Kef-type K+ transport system membrane component KefB/mannitol/fructose-specific phosphotransferase system IIA component (Ntr-type)